MQAVRVVAGVRPSGHHGRGARVAGRLHDRYDPRVVVAGGVAEPVDRHVVALLERPTGDGDLAVQPFGAERDQVGVAEALRVELPARGHEAADLRLPEAAL